MKSKIFKIVLPAFAFMMAIALSFAAGVVDVAPTGYYNDFGVIKSVATDCTEDGGALCTFNGFQLYDTPAQAQTGTDGGELKRP